MGLLDDLKQQANAQKQQTDTNQADQAQNAENIQKALKAVYKYLTELANSLNVIKPEVRRTFHIDTSSKLENLLQTDYRVTERKKTVEQRDRLEEVALRFRWTGPEPVQITKDNPVHVERLRNDLWSVGLKFDCKEQKNDRGAIERATFSVPADIPGTAAFIGNIETGRIKLQLKNVEMLGDLELQYSPDELDHLLLEEFAKVLLAKQNNFRRMGQYQQMMATTTRSKPPAQEVQYRTDPAPAAKAPAKPAEKPAAKPQAEAAEPDQPAEEQKSGLFGTIKSILTRPL